MKKTAFILSLILFVNIASAQDKTADTAGSKPLVFMADANILGDTVNITPVKADAALVAAVKLSQKYSIAPMTVRDSLAQTLAENDKKPTAKKIAEIMNADKLIFMTVNRLKNMIRVEIAAKGPDPASKARRGIGYALIRYYKQQRDDIPLIDPTLLHATQRAFAAAMNDSSMFSHLEGDLEVYPARTLVIGGLIFQNDSRFRDWELFDYKEINSYDAVETIFKAATESRQYVPYDVASRDSIYAIYNMYGVENYKSPSTFELEALSELEVQSYITGMFTRTEEGATIELYLADIENSRLEINKSAAGSISEDDIEEFREELQRLTRELLDIHASESEQEQKNRE